MSRVIKFRGLTEHEPCWIYGMPRYFNSGRVDMSDRYGDFYVRPETVSQFTGLLDKNGKEIYEGDIVVKDGYIWFDNCEPNYRGTVEWIFSQWQVVAHCVNKDKRGISDGINEGINDDGVDDGENTRWIVLGNVHENPELI